MAFAAENNTISVAGWMLFAAAVLWPLIYDTMYAMVDRDDDIKIGLKSTAILFGKRDQWILGVLQGAFIILLAIAAIYFTLPYRIM